MRPTIRSESETLAKMDSRIRELIATPEAAATYDSVFYAAVTAHNEQAGPGADRHNGPDDELLAINLMAQAALAATGLSGQGE